MNPLGSIIAGLIGAVTKFLLNKGFKDAANVIKVEQSNLEERLTKVIDQSIKNITFTAKENNVKFNIHNHIHLEQVMYPYICDTMLASGSFIEGVVPEPTFPNEEPYIQKLERESYE
ncbi:MAG: hypothetical protein KAW02_01490 [candidate division Zixibacteria bacterium]|nr:hypothetical protein [candidate division Zixibacteria bacterium]